MGITKTIGFADDIVQMSDVFKALGHPARLEILSYIKLFPNATCKNIVEHIPLSQSTISKHLSELKIANIIICTQKGSSVSYVLNVEVLNQSGLFINKFSDKIFTKKPKILKNIDVENHLKINESAIQTAILEPKIQAEIESKNPEIPVYKPSNKPKRSREFYSLKKYNFTFKKLKK